MSEYKSVKGLIQTKKYCLYFVLSWNIKGIKNVFDGRYFYFK